MSIDLIFSAIRLGSYLFYVGRKSVEMAMSEIVSIPISLGAVTDFLEVFQRENKCTYKFRISFRGFPCIKTDTGITVVSLGNLSVSGNLSNSGRLNKNVQLSIKEKVSEFVFPFKPK